MTLDSEAELILRSRANWNSVLQSYDPLSWATETAKLTLPKSGPLDFEQHPFLVQPYRDINDEIVFLKGAQLGMSTLAIVRALWASTTFPMNVVYCVDAQTEALTKRGWLSGAEVNDEDELLTLDPTTMRARWTRPNSVYRGWRRGEMVELRHRSFSALVTPNHRWLTVPVHGRLPHWDEAATLPDHRRIPIRADVDLGVETSEVSGDLAELMGWVVTEGSYVHQSPGQSTIVITQAETSPHVARIRALVRRLGITSVTGDLGGHEYQQDGCIRFYIRGLTPRLIRSMLPTKELTPEFVASLDREALDRLVEAMLLGDGNGRDRFWQTSRRTTDAFGMAVALLGRGVSFARRVRDHYDAPQGHVQGWFEQNLVTIRKSQSVATEKLTRRSVFYDGPIWCPSSRDGTFLARREGTVYWTGNTMPTSDDVSRYTAARINPMVASSKYLTDRILDVDSVRVKQFSLDPLPPKQAGQRRAHVARVSTIYFSGAQTEKDPTTVDADLLIHDEEDRSNPQIIEQFESRLDHSRYKWKMRLSTPTVPGAGIDRAFRKTDQRAWLIRCPHCNHDFEMDFPANIEPHTIEEVEAGATARYVCDRCKGTIGDEARATGRWVAALTDARAHGYALSQMAAPWISATRILERYAKAGYEGDFWNLVMGRAWVSSTSEFTRDAILQRSDPMWPMATSGSSCTMGVDVGSLNDVIIGVRDAAGTPRTVHMARVDGYEPLDRLMADFGVVMCVIDALPNEQPTRQWAAKYPGRVFRATYSRQVQEPKWDNELGKVTLPRDTILSMAADELLTTRLLPRFDSSPAWEAFIRHHENSHKVPQFAEGARDEGEDREVARYTWVANGADHLFHAAAYEMVARMAIPERIVIPHHAIAGLRRDGLTHRPLELQGGSHMPYRGRRR